MANGYATLVTLLGDDRNVPLIQEAIDKNFWRIAIFVDSAVALLTEYFTVNKIEPYKDDRSGLWDAAAEHVSEYAAELPGVSLPVHLPPSRGRHC